jgi:TRAP-type C4-dicarboxylate transport system substrate-binding protein
VRAPTGHSVPLAGLVQRLHTAVAVLVLVAAAGCSGQSAADKAGGSGGPVTLRIGTSDQPGRPGSEQIEEFRRQVERLSGRRLRIQPVWQAAGRNVDDWDQRVGRMVVRGELDLGHVPARAWDTEGVTTLRALSAPFLVTSDELLQRVVEGELAGRLLAGLDGLGLVGLALVPEGLRHPFAYGEPLLGPEDYEGALVRAPTSAVTTALFEALGATADDLDGSALERAVADSKVAAAESSFVWADALGGRTVATGNVTFFPKVNSLVVNGETFEGLTDEQQRILRDAAERTRAWAVQNMPSDAEGARAYCDHGGTVVLASEDDLASLERATAPVYAELERDADTRSLIEEIRGLKSEIGPPRATPRPCGGSVPADDGDEQERDPALLNGVWRTNVVYEEAVAAGLPPDVAAGESGVHTIRMEDGRHEWRWRARDGEHFCPGTYTIRGAKVEFREHGGCNGLWEAEYELLDGEIRWRNARTQLEGARTDQLIREQLHGTPWKRIGDVGP